MIRSMMDNQILLFAANMGSREHVFRTIIFRTIVIYFYCNSDGCLWVFNTSNIFFLSFRYPEFTTEKIIHGFRGDAVRGALQIGILHPASHFFGWNNGMQRRSYTIKHCAQSTLMKRLRSFKELKFLFTKSLKLISLLCSFAVHLSNIVGLTKH